MIVRESGGDKARSISRKFEGKASMYKAGSQIDVLKKVHAACSSVEGCGKRRWCVSQLVTRQGLALHIYAPPDCLALWCNF